MRNTTLVERQSAAQSRRRRPRPSRESLNRELYELSDRVPANAMTISELRRLVAVFTEADDRLAGRKRKPARVLLLVPTLTAD